MNIYQKIILFLSILIVIGMGLYPPFYIKFRGSIFINMGYSFILDPPKYNNEVECLVNIKLLITQWFGVVLVTIMAVSVFIKGQKK